MKDEAYLWYDVTQTCKILGNPIPDYAMQVVLTDEEAERYQRFLHEEKYWQDRFDRAKNEQ